MDAQVPWVKVEGPPDSGYDRDRHIGYCSRCGALIPKPKLPATFESVIRYLRVAAREHIKCEELE